MIILRPCPHNAVVIWKRSFFVHIRVPFTPVTKTELLENAFQTGEIWKCRLRILVWTENILKTKMFENDGVTTITWFSCQSFPQAQLKMTGGFCVLNSSSVTQLVDGEEWMHFQSETSVFNFLSVVWKREDVFRLEPSSCFVRDTCEITSKTGCGCSVSLKKSFYVSRILVGSTFEFSYSTNNKSWTALTVHLYQYTAMV